MHEPTPYHSVPFRFVLFRLFRSASLRYVLFRSIPFPPVLFRTILSNSYLSRFIPIYSVLLHLFLNYRLLLKRCCHDVSTFDVGTWYASQTANRLKKSLEPFDFQFFSILNRSSLSIFRFLFYL